MSDLVEQLEALAETNEYYGFNGRTEVYAAAAARITELETALAEARNAALEEAAKVADDPGFIQARDTEWDTGFNDAKRIIAQAIRDMKDRT